MIPEALWTALQQLGYTPYHGSELFANAEFSHSKCWQEGLAARYYTGKTYGQMEFYKLLGNYDAVTDCPCAYFAEELIAAYPNAKVILTTRDPDRWDPMTYLEPNEWGAFRKLIRIGLMDMTAGDWQNRRALREGFLQHNARVRSLVPEERLLEFRVEQGWGALCQFLQKPEPATEFRISIRARKLQRQ